MKVLARREIIQLLAEPGEFAGKTGTHHKQQFEAIIFIFVFNCTWHNANVRRTMFKGYTNHY